MSIDQARDNRANLSGVFAALFSNATVDQVYAPYGLFLFWPGAAGWRTSATTGPIS